MSSTEEACSSARTTGTVSSRTLPTLPRYSLNPRFCVCVGYALFNCAINGIFLNPSLLFVSEKFVILCFLCYSKTLGQSALAKKILRLGPLLFD